MATFSAIPAHVKQKLWKHQIKALDFAVHHLNAFATPCLIRMPTGTGKTGVIACLSRVANSSTTLVLTPWTHLRKQMEDDLSQAFWKKVGLAPSGPQVVSISPSNAVKLLQSNEPRVFVCTFAALNDLRLDYGPIYEDLARHVSLVIVDEGHYEPAVQWGKSVKGLDAKTVLLTATPYRNDLKLFRITNATQSTHHFTHKQATENAIIRQLQFEPLVCEVDIPSLSASFASKWKALKKASALPASSPRAIVCCSQATDIEQAVTHIRSAGLNAIGIHEQFEHSRDPALVKDVPGPDEVSAEIWVHQHKLTEGLDDHRFCCVALFTRIRNDRKLIQQIGRVLRRNSNDRPAPALLVAPHFFSPKEEWEAYLEFETQFKLLEPQHFRDVVTALLTKQPKVEYFEGRFRRRFVPEVLTTNPQVVIPPSVLVRELSTGFSIDQYIEDCTDTLNTEDAVILGPDINEPCQRGPKHALWVYASVRNSRFLQESSLYEIRLETHCVVIADGFLFMSDSSGTFPLEYLEERTTSVPAEKLVRFIDASFRPTHVSLDSSIPYDTVVRGADVRGHNLLTVPASLTDRVHICRSARGTSKHGRRYVGMNHGRLRSEVSDSNRRTFELTRFISWAQELAKILKSQRPGNELFRRYMPTCAPPVAPVPKTISLDLARLDLTLSLPDGKECALGSSSCDVVANIKANQTIYTCAFAVQTGGAKPLYINLGLSYDAAKQRFWFSKSGGTSVQVTLDGQASSSAKGLAEFLNQNQEIVLIGLTGGDIVYQGRKFYKVDYTYAETVLLELILRPTGAPVCRTEKGSDDQIKAAKQAGTTTFPDGSVFAAIANRRIGLPFVDELLICDDLGTECADFVAADMNSRQLALIHAKAGTGARISASAFHDVVSQAMKNLVYLTRSKEVPKNVASWRRDRKWNGTGIPRLFRAPQGVASATTLWEGIRNDIINSSNPGLYVVLATTGCCDVAALKQAINDPSKRTPEVAQILHLLDGLNAYARQLGVRLIVCDLPYRAP